MRSVTWLGVDDIDKLRPAIGVAAETVLSSNTLSGWIFQPGQELTSVQLYLNGEPLAWLPLFERPDVAAIYPRFSSALHSGYHLILPARLIRSDDVNRVTAVGCCEDKPCCRTRGIALAEDFVPEAPIPPLDLLERSQGSDDVSMYRHAGYRFYREVLDAVARHRDPNSIRRVLDWGCGTGRVTIHFIQDPRKYAVDACDPHAASIAWCQANLPGGRFEVSPREPPLGYPDSSFDLIFALGVVYRFSRSEFAQWLQELRRIITNRGILVLSIQGPLAAAIRFPPDALEILAQNGILSSDEYEAKNPRSPDEPLFRAGFYWTPECVKQTASPHFRVIDYYEAAFTVDQDLVVLEPVD